MKRKWTTPAIMLTALAAATAVTALFATGQVENWTQRQLLARQKSRIEAASEADAAQLVHELGSLDATAVPLLVHFLADERDPVNHAAQREIDQLLDSWQQLPAGEAAARYGIVAHCLAAEANRTPESRQPAARRIALRILAMPVRSDAPSAHELINDCETVLRLSSAAETESALLIAEQLPTTAPIAETAPPLPLQRELTAAPPTNDALLPVAEAPEVRPIEPQRLEEPPAGQPTEPRRFLAPKAMRIEG